MSAFSLVYTRALPIFATDNANIPYPTVNQIGVTTSSVGPNTLTDSAATFITNGVAPGDIVYNLTDGLVATVVTVLSQTQLTLNANITAAVSKNYIVYQASSQTTIGNYGCYLYIGGAGNVNVTTIGDDSVTFAGIPAGTILPVQVRRLRAGTTATNIIALW